jgi:hypothetical protein
MLCTGTPCASFEAHRCFSRAPCASGCGGANRRWAFERGLAKNHRDTDYAEADLGAVFGRLLYVRMRFV